jgi:hypothetical protein
MKDYRAEDRRQRERLERNTGAGTRVNMAAQVNALAKGRAGREMPGLSAYGVIRLLQSNGAAEAREARRHNRAHDAYLARAFDPPPEPDRNIPGDDPPYDDRYVTPIVEGRTYVSVGEGGTTGVSGSARAMYEPEGISVEGMRALALAKAAASRYW